ncbi:MAG: PfkB family carbohydrate kinase [Treponema sp.]|nr:PfkB family carbohydrate kinase [Treponema sp.]
MKQTLVIGSTVIDIIITIPHIPVPGEDININNPDYRLGGCAYNVFETLRFLESPAILCSAVGTGVHGRMVMERLTSRGIKPLINIEEENGCCYCLVEQNGERSFLSHHGAEYIFYKSWLKGMDFTEVDSVYISGIDVEDPTGIEIVGFLYDHPNLSVYFAPGPRIMKINPSRMKKIIEFRDKDEKGPVLHLNMHEACDFSGKHNYKEAAQALAERTNNVVIITLREKGCYSYDKNARVPGIHAPGFKAKVLDTTGAGDAHCGAIISELKQGKSLEEACRTANRIAAAATEIHGVVLDKDARLP